MFSGRQDTTVPYARQSAFCDRYRAAGNRCEQHSYDAGHGLGIENLADIMSRTTAFLRQHVLAPNGY
jgi:predicted esterase